MDKSKSLQGRKFLVLRLQALLKCLALVCYLGTASVFAQTKHVVVDLETVLLQQIPYRNFQNFVQKDQMFQVTVDGKYLSFYTHLYAKEWAREIQKRPGVALSIVSERDLATTKLILQSIKHDSYTKDNLYDHILSKQGKILSFENKTNGSFDLSGISSQLETVVFLTHNPSKVLQKDRALDLGKSFYKFETWAQAEASLGSAAEADRVNYPSSEAEWKAESYKIARLGHAFLSQVSTVDPKNLKAKLDAPFEKSIAIGELILAKKGLPTQTFWVSSEDGKLLRCETIDLQKDVVTKTMTVKECLGVLSAKKSWATSPDKKKVDACVVENLSGAKVLLPVADCLGSDEKAFWNGKAQANCSYYTPDLVFITSAPAALCKTQHVLAHPQTGQNTVVSYFPGMEKKTIAQIFAEPPPTKYEPFSLYNPLDVDKTVGFTLKDCQDPSENDHPVKIDGNGNLPEKCRPDTFYSWGPMIKIQDLEKFMGGSKWRSGFRTIFMTRSPLATFGYGVNAIRIKIKKGVKWIRDVYGCRMSDGPAIYYNPWNPGLDYTFCDPSVIESWSYGTKEHYDEIIKEYRWFEDPKNTANNEIDAYGNYGRSTVSMLYTQNWDGHNFSRATLKSNLGAFQDLIDNDKGEIHFNPDSQGPKTREEHFKTAKPIYFNER